MTAFNRPETEQDGMRAEALRRLKVRQMLPAKQGRTPYIDEDGQIRYRPLSAQEEHDRENEEPQREQQMLGKQP